MARTYTFGHMSSIKQLSTPKVVCARYYNTVDEGLKQGGWVLQRSKTHQVYERYVKQTFVRPSTPGTSNEHRSLNMLRRNDIFVNLHAYRTFLQQANSNNMDFVMTDEESSSNDIDYNSKYHKVQTENEAFVQKNFSTYFNYWQSVIDESRKLLLDTKNKHEYELKEMAKERDSLLMNYQSEIDKLNSTIADLKGKLTKD
jgi:hypothetical protein